MSPNDTGGCEIKAYDLDGNLLNTYKIDIDSISVYSAQAISGSDMSFFPEGDMALGANKLFIVWYKEDITLELEKSKVYGIVYDLNGNKIKDKFLIRTGQTGWNGYENAEVEAGSKYFLVAHDDKIFLYDMNANLVSQRESGLSHIHDLAYGDGKFLTVEENEPNSTTRTETTPGQEPSADTLTYPRRSHTGTTCSSAS